MDPYYITEKQVITAYSKAIASSFPVLRDVFSQQVGSSSNHDNDDQSKTIYAKLTTLHSFNNITSATSYLHLLTHSDFPLQY